MNFLTLIIAILLLSPLVLRPASSAAEGQATPIVVPPVPREFRGVWVATVENIDWPSKRGLPVAKQQAELLAILDKAALLHLNAVLLQIRPACDALYNSALEPWSEYLTGTQGQAPQPAYDPLAFAVDEAHKRGIELHAWFNPYRARHPSAKSAPAANHISRTHPEIVRRYAGQMWLDPGEEATQAHSLAVVMDVVRRYDIDGVHIDDYFYPYPENDAKGHEIPFPDDSSYHRYREGGGTLDRGDWRRENVNHFIERLYKAIKEAKPWVKFGISPFGIWRPGYPAQIKGYDAYSRIYCDTRKWLQEGWLDYLTPQLYWKIEQTPQSFPVLLDWWISQNAHGRHIWPGSYTSMVGDDGGKRHWPASEILYQIRIARGNAGAQGDVQFSMKALMQNYDGLADRLLKEVYAEPTLVPASPWLGGEAPEKPVISVDPPAQGALQASWYGNDSDHVWQWALQWRVGGIWHTQVLPASELSTRFALTPGSRPDVVAVSGVDRYGNQGLPAVIDLRTVSKSEGE